MTKEGGALALEEIRLSNERMWQSFVAATRVPEEYRVPMGSQGGGGDSVSVNDEQFTAFNTQPLGSPAFGEVGARNHAEDFPEGALSEADVERQALGHMALRRHHLLRRIAETSAPFDDALAALAEEVDQVREQQAQAVAPLERDVAFIDSQMELVFRRKAEESGDKTFKLPFVTYGLRRSPDTVEITDSAKLLETCQQTPALLDSLFVKKVTIQPNKRTIMAHIKGTGEVLEGVEFHPGEVKFKVIAEGDKSPDQADGVNEEEKE